MQIEGDTTRKNLIRIISQYSRSILDDPKKLKNLLFDLNQGIERKEVNIICTSLEDMVPFDLIKNKDNLPYEISSEQAIRRLKNNYGITEDLARWTIETWAVALNIISPTGIPHKKVQRETKKTEPKTKSEPVRIDFTTSKTKQDYNIRPVSTPKPTDSSPVIVSKNQITGKYEQNKFVLLLAGICLAMPFILIWLFPNAKVQSSGLLDQIIAWSSMIWIVLSFILLAAFGGYIFRLKDSPSQSKINVIPNEISQKSVNNYSTITGKFALGLFILSILLMSSGNMGLGGAGVFALMASMTLAIYFLGKSSKLF
jgi:hypothetical protein